MITSMINLDMVTHRHIRRYVCVNVYACTCTHLYVCMYVCLSGLTVVLLGKSQLRSQHGSLLIVNLPATNQGQAQWKHHDHQAWTHSAHWY